MSTRRSLAGWLLVLMFGLMVPVLFVGCDGLFIDIMPGTTTQPADNDDDGFYVTVETVGNGKVLVDPKRTSFSGNAKVRLSAIPDSDWQFDHWEGDVAGSKPIVGLTINEDVHVTAVFIRIPVDMVKLEIVSVGHGVVDIVPEGEVVEEGLLYPEGTRTTLVADADSGWVFLGYYDESGVLLSEDEVTDLVLYDDYLIVAKFERLAPPPPPSFFDTEIVAADGQFLGYINDDPFDSEGLANPYGVYGDEFSVFSIWNPFSIYGSEFSDLSAYDPYAADPPGLYLDDVLIGYLTKNPDFFPQIDPDDVADAIGRYDVIRD